MRVFRYVACSLLLALPSVRMAAQAVSPRVVDKRLRVTTRQAGVVTGRVVRVTTDSVALRDDRTRDERSVAQTDILAVQQSSGMSRGRAAQRGALIGAGLGIAALTAGLLADAQVDGEMMGLTNLAIAAPVAVLLTLLGAGIGAASGGEVWKPVTTAGVGSNVQLGRTVQVGLRVRF